MAGNRRFRDNLWAVSNLHKGRLGATSKAKAGTMVSLSRLSRGRLSSTGQSLDYTNDENVDSPK
jgi:hypothetical protein